MQKVNRNVLLSSLVLIALLCLSSVSAVDMDDKDFVLPNPNDGAIAGDSILCSDSSSNDDLLEEIESNDNSNDNSVCSNDSNDSNDSNYSNESDDLKDFVYVVDSDNLTSYFDDGVLKEDFNDSVLIFNGEFDDKGTLSIKSPGVKVIGNNSLLINTVFSVLSDNVALSGLNFVLDEKFSSNKNAGIFITGDNCTVFNNSISYSTPVDVTGIGIYSRNNVDLKIINNTISFIGNALRSGFNYAMVLTGLDNALVLGNNITSLLPLRTVNYNSQTIYGGVGKNNVASFAADSCYNLTFSGNTINSSVYNSYGGYPTLSSVVFSTCYDSLIEWNNITEVDYITKKGVDNYLYALDIYGSNNLLIAYNNIDVFTEGGKYAAGTAYPIQLSFSTDIKIAYNNLSSFSNGPNLGIYSWGGELEIINNFINVTGLAGAHEWALVAGIEVQDTNDTIWNNTVIAQSVEDYKSGDNLYGISYAQYLHGGHEYNIQYNNISSGGSIAVSIDSSSGYNTNNSMIINNLLVTAFGDGGDAAARFGADGFNNVIANNSNGRTPYNQMSEDEIPSWLANYLSLNKDYSIDLSWLDYHSGSNTAYGPSFHTDGSSGNGNSLNGNGNGNGFNFNSDVNGRNSRFSRSNSTNGDLNSTHYAVGDSGLSLAAASASAGSGESSSADASDRNAYEIDEKDNVAIKSVDYLQLGIICIVVLLLLLVGYKRQKDKEEEE